MNEIYNEHKKVNYGKIEIHHLQKTFLSEFNPILTSAELNKFMKMSKNDLLKIIKLMFLKYFIITLGLKVFAVLAQYTGTYMMDLVNDRLKLLNPNDKTNN